MLNAGDWLCEMLETVTQEMVGSSVPVVSRIPQTFKEKDLLDTAASEEFDLAIFLLNNISYASNETPFLEENSIALVTEVVVRYGKPVIALYGKPDDDPGLSRPGAGSGSDGGPSFTIQAPGAAERPQEMH